MSSGLAVRLCSERLDCLLLWSRRWNSTAVRLVATRAAGGVLEVCNQSIAELRPE